MTLLLETALLDDIGFNFIKKCLSVVESRGLNEQGLYRVVGVNSKVNKLIAMGLDPKKKDKIQLDDPQQFEIKTITSAVKNYLRSLPEPLMTYKLHNQFIAAAKQETNTLRVHDIHTLVHKLPEPNFEMLELLMAHLQKIADNSDRNFMNVANIGVCFGPTLMRSEEESVAAIMDIKFCNIIVEILILNYEKIFKTPPEGADIADCRVMPQAGQVSNKCVAPVTNHTMMDNRISLVQQPVYANKAPVYPSYAVKQATKLRAVDIYNPTTGGFETHAGSSTSGSSDSLNSSQSNHLSMNTSSPQLDSTRQRGPVYTNVNALANRYNLMSGSDIPTLTSSMGSMSASYTGSLMGPGSHSINKPKKRTVRTLYQCTAENDTELSFEPNLIIHHVRPSKEPGWLEGTLNGKTGLLPENYVEYID
ncbi:hypothetical protein KUTeg_024998 [Tegillarca granosa]|uniref:Rho GTPase-activating protein 26 n=1 Tax=Tegillarca granosa TaxID=220873 RepID=A0ABQ9E4G8_TEGGR|nr:hypothetical protein KUTeg_024998 [Tegillarca granosa]